MSLKEKTSYIIAVVPFNFNLNMLEDLKKELPFLLEQYLSKKHELYQKVWDGLDKKIKSEIENLFLSMDEMLNYLERKFKDGVFVPPLEFSDHALPTIAEIFFTFPPIYKFDGLIREMCLVYMVTLFESFLENVLRITFEKCPECLSSPKSITFEEVVANLESNNGVLNAIIKKEIGEVLRYDIEEIDKYFLKKFKIKISEYVPNWSEFKEMFYRRNILLHNMGIVNEEYRIKTGYKGEEKRLYVSEDYLDKSFQLFGLMSRKILGTFFRKFEKQN